MRVGVRRALISVSDKTGIVAFAKGEKEMEAQGAGADFLPRMSSAMRRSRLPRG